MGSLTGTVSRPETTASALLAGFSTENTVGVFVFYYGKTNHVVKEPVYMNENQTYMVNVETNTINIILTLYKMMCNTNVRLAAGWFEPRPAGGARGNV